MALGLQPANFGSTVQQVHSISDEIWHQTGDRALDFSWYTKRALLSKIYVATELYMLQDQSPDKAATWEFLDRRLDDVMTVGGAVNMHRDTAEAMGVGLKSLFDLATSST
jgi:ubiquinone biosynthesis protein COQ9